MGRPYTSVVILLLLLVQDGLARPGGLEDELRGNAGGLLRKLVKREVVSEEEDDEAGPAISEVNSDEEDEGSLRRKRGTCENFVGDTLQIEVDTVDVEPEALTIHNELREIHGSPALTTDTGLEATASAYAEQLCRDPDKKFEHSTNNERNGAGENLFKKMQTIGQKALDKALAKGTFKSKQKSSPGDAVCSWYKEEECFDFTTGKQIPGCGIVGHFTQEVWAKTLKIGCARATCNRMDLKSCKPTIVNFVVCHYSPHGNVSGGGKNNVPATDEQAKSSALHVACKK